MAGKVIVIDDEKNLTLVVQAMLERAGFSVSAFQSSEIALQSLASSQTAVDVVITDLYMPGPGGMEVLEYCKKNRPDLPVVLITAHGTVESAVAALKQGAFDYITKPFEQSELLEVVKKAVLTGQQSQKEPTADSSIIGTSSQILEVFKVITKIAASPSTVLILGESGTGKELVAFEIHRRSERAQKPFIKINCAAIPATLIESELFGHEKGAFTGAIAAKPGRFELAHEGTLFLDEVADMPLEMQVKLLRAIQEHEFERVGGIETIEVDVRIVTATNKDLEAEVKAGRFREDLFYRLNVVPIHLPALRERKEDIEPLAKFFLQQFNEKLKKDFTGFTLEALNALRNFPWPGNIRQLENVIERMVLMSEGQTLRLSDLPPEFGIMSPDEGDTTAPATFKEIVKRQTQSLERDLIEKALEETAGNVTRAAEKLGLSRKGLQLKIKELGLKRPLD